MIEGIVDERLRTLVEVTIKDSNGVFRSLPAIVDTGSQFSLVLPREINSRLGLELKDSARLVRAAGSVNQLAAAYRAEIIWDGYNKEIEVVEMNNPPLIGTELLEGYNINIEMRRAGRVVLEPLAAW